VPLPRSRKVLIGAAVIAVCFCGLALVSIGVPPYQKAILRSNESVLRHHLSIMRTVIHEYAFDRHKGPKSLQDLVSEGYLRAVPIDPITKSSSTWRVVMEDARTDVVVDVHSGSDARSLDGTLYSEW
jgi:general secretion pathway protein G